jgi:hypothetical protein
MVSKTKASSFFLMAFSYSMGKNSEGSLESYFCFVAKKLVGRWAVCHALINQVPTIILTSLYIIIT